MNNWQYAHDYSASIWRSSMAVPRELNLVTVGGNVRLTQTPVAEINNLRGTSDSWTNQTITPGSNLISAVTGNTVEIVAEFQDNTAGATTEYGFKVRKSTYESTKIGYDRTNSKLFVDRTGSGDTAFNSAFGARHEVSMSPDGNV